MTFFAIFIKESDVDKIINQTNKLIERKTNDTNRAFFIASLKARYSEFTTELQRNISQPGRNEILNQYYKFAKTVFKCLESPQRAKLSIARYLNSNYYPVGISDFTKPEPPMINAAWLGIEAGITLLLISLPLFAVNPVIAAILLATAVTVLLPSVFMVLTPDTPDVMKKKEQELKIFQDAAILMDPTLVFEYDGLLESASTLTTNP